MPGNSDLLLLLIALIQAQVGLCWLLSWLFLGVPRGTAGRCVAATVFMVAAMVTIMLQPYLPDAVMQGAVNVLFTFSVLSFRHALRHFLHLRIRKREMAVIVLLAVAANTLPRASAVPQALSVPLVEGITTALLAFMLWRQVLDCYRPLRKLWGPRTAKILSLPSLLGALFCTFRGVLALYLPSVAARPIADDTHFNLLSLLVYLLISTGAHMCLAYLVMMRLIRKLQDLSQRDSLTGLTNRREWMRQLQTQHRWLRRDGEPYTVVAIDIDHFKQVNDQWGHPAGDAVLVSVAQVLTSTVREVDCAGRLGGEEFMVLLPRTGLDAGLALAERLRIAIAAAPVDWRGTPIQITASLGVAEASSPDEDPSGVVTRADKALYQAKTQGRNRTVGANPPPMAGPAGNSSPAAASADL